MQLRWHLASAFRAARGTELYRGPRAVLVLVRGGRRPGPRAPSPVLTRPRRALRLYAYGERRGAPPAAPATSPSSFAPTITDANFTAGSVPIPVTSAIGSAWEWNVRRRRNVLSYENCGVED
jgi:hypothetical protein